MNPLFFVCDFFYIRLDLYFAQYCSFNKSFVYAAYFPFMHEVQGVVNAFFVVLKY